MDKKTIQTSSKVSYRNQTVVPAAVRDSLNVEPGDRINWQIVETDKGRVAVVYPKPESVVRYTKGKARGVWDRDATEYVRNLREEWDHDKNTT